ncbi:hypothetical protein E3N88_38300 [Mikania micrantha]|uniref:Uncharacterized protein n=1 Tax=Mikania micrantha TaxID=192012 RepID=A0A5N6LTP1_9ASTR|nr:hypothetical protein E3N88_38300 [Mikania micrantha]
MGKKKKGGVGKKDQRVLGHQHRERRKLETVRKTMNTVAILIDASDWELLGLRCSSNVDEFDEHVEPTSTTTFVAEEHGQAKATETEQATSSGSSTEYVFEKQERFPVNQHERELMKKSKASDASKSTDDKDEDYVPYPESAPKRRLKMVSRRSSDPRLKKQKPTPQTTQPLPTPKTAQTPQQPPSPQTVLVTQT